MAHTIKNIMYTRKYSIALFFLLFCFPQAITAAEVVSASRVPWSGYWWPHSEGALVTGNDYYDHPAPLEKYDLLTLGVYPSTLSRWYNTTYYDPYAPAWYGHCLAWSKASMLENYDIFPSSEDNIHFRVGDKKGLLTIAHNKDLYELGDQTASTFHFWLLNYIKDQSTPFIADLDTSAQKWYYPIFKYELESVTRGNIESVSVTVYYVSNFVHPDFMGAEIQTIDYTYDLELDNDGNIMYGSWTGDSVVNHPHLLFYPLQQFSDAPGLNYLKVKQIAQNRDDFLEDLNSPAALEPGRYNLILLNEDTYSIPVTGDDILSLQVVKVAGSLENIEVTITDSKDLITTATLDEGNQTYTFRPSANDTPPYSISLTQNNYETDPNLYSIIVDQGKVFEQHLPYFPNILAWRGFAVTNAQDTAVDNVMLITRDITGNPIQTVWGPLTLEPHEKRVFLFESLDYRKHEFNSIDAITLQADAPLHYVNLIGRTDSPVLAEQVQNNSYGEHVVIPVTTVSNDVNDILFSFIANNSFDINSITIKVYESNGTLFMNHEQELGSWEKVEIKPGFGGLGDLPENGWIDIVSTDKLDISGYSYHKTNLSATGLFALLPDSATRYVPHVPESVYWDTEVTIINNSPTENRIVLHPLLAGADTSSDIAVVLASNEKRSISIGADFGSYPGDSNYHSVIEIKGSADFAGYFSYQFDGKEKAAYPLAMKSDMFETLTLPHYPDSTAWWTGMVLANINTYDISVEVTAFNNAGEKLEETYLLDIRAGAYELFTVAALFGDQAAESIAYVSAQTTKAFDKACGLFLYGARLDNNSLSGSLMH